jgi:hypothetical protein
MPNLIERLDVEPELDRVALHRSSQWLPRGLRNPDASRGPGIGAAQHPRWRRVLVKMPWDLVATSLGWSPNAAEFN